MSTSTHSVRLDDELWSEAQKKAAGTGTTMTKVIDSALRGYVKGRWAPQPGAAEVFTARLDRIEAEHDALAREVTALKQMAGLE